jgi:hypothetical protein
VQASNTREHLQENKNSTNQLRKQFYTKTFTSETKLSHANTVKLHWYVFGYSKTVVQYKSVLLT